MMTELVLVEGVSDILLISYYLQKVYGWKSKNSNNLGITALEECEHIESLYKGENQLVVCGVGGNGKYKSFVEKHRINDMIIEQDISSLMIVTDRDENTDAKINRTINGILDNIIFKVGEWNNNKIIDSFQQPKYINTYLLIIPENENGALERVIINSLSKMPEHAQLISEVVDFVDTLKDEPDLDLKKISKANKATVGTFFSIRNPQNAMRAFGIHISSIDWSKSEVLKKIFLPFDDLGKNKSISMRIIK